MACNDYCWRAYCLFVARVVTFAPERVIIIITNIQGQIIMKGTIILVKDAVISISMISRAANVFAARLVRHRSAACEFSRGRFDVSPCILVIMQV